MTRRRRGNLSGAGGRRTALGPSLLRPRRRGLDRLGWRVRRDRGELVPARFPRPVRPHGPLPVQLRLRLLETRPVARPPALPAPGVGPPRALPARRDPLHDDERRRPGMRPRDPPDPPPPPPPPPPPLSPRALSVRPASPPPTRRGPAGGRPRTHSGTTSYIVV